MGQAQTWSNDVCPCAVELGQYIVTREAESVVKLSAQEEKEMGFNGCPEAPITHLCCHLQLLKISAL